MAAANISVNPLSLMGDSSVVLEVIGSTMDEEQNIMSFDIQRNNHGHGVTKDRSRTLAKQDKCLKSVSRVLLLIVIVIAATVMALPLIPYHTGSHEVTILKLPHAWACLEQDMHVHLCHKHVRECVIL